MIPLSAYSNVFGCMQPEGSQLTRPFIQLIIHPLETSHHRSLQLRNHMTTWPNATRLAYENFGEVKVRRNSSVAKKSVDERSQAISDPR